VVAASTAGDGDASLVGDNPIMVNGVATATVALTGTYAAAAQNTLTVSQKTILVLLSQQQQAWKLLKMHQQNNIGAFTI